MEPNLLLICASAAIAVFLLLTLLAIAMRVLIAVFPEETDQGDVAMLAAVATAVSAAYPGTRITDVTEIR
jgi:hypothetical protein